MSLDKAVIDLDFFGNNMEYVALSRVRTSNGLAILSLNLARFSNRHITCLKSLNELKIEPYNDSLY